MIITTESPVRIWAWMNSPRGPVKRGPNDQTRE